MICITEEVSSGCRCFRSGEDGETPEVHRVVSEGGRSAQDEEGRERSFQLYVHERAGL